MAEQSIESILNRNMYMQQLNFVLNSYCKIGDILVLPLKVDIREIKATFEESTYHKIDMFYDGGSLNLSYDTNVSQAPVFKNYEKQKLYNTIIFCYDYIDWTLPMLEEGTYADLYGIYNKEDFLDFCLNTHLVGLGELRFIEMMIVQLINKAKSIFIDKVMNIFDVNKDFPKIKLKDSDWECPDEWAELMSYDYNMISFQVASEFPMSVWFSENYGKGFYDWSWREHEAKRFYITKKHKIEDFREKVKAYNMEKTMEENKPK